MTAGEPVVSSLGPARLPRVLADAIVAHARAEHPNESCGLVIGTAPVSDGGDALRYEALRNRAASPVRYEIHPDDLIRVAVAVDDADEVFWGIVHSHVRSAAVPSPTDVGLAFYPDALYLLVSLADEEADPESGAPSLRAWRIVDGEVREVTLALS